MSLDLEELCLFSLIVLQNFYWLLMLHSRGSCVSPLHSTAIWIVPEGNQPFTGSGGKVFPSVDTMSALSGFPPWGHSLYQVTSWHPFFSCLDCFICINRVARVDFFLSSFFFIVYQLSFINCHGGACIMRICFSGKNFLLYIYIFGAVWFIEILWKLF